MTALPGNHYCEAHQGNAGHYARENCDLCKALADRATLKSALALTEERVRDLQSIIHDMLRVLLKVELPKELEDELRRAQIQQKG
jgi:hypothetical protein